MTTVQIAIYIVFICAEIFGISMFMEWYKKTLRKGNSKVWEVRLIGIVLSAIAVALLVGINIFKPILGMIGAPIWADYIVYTILFFYLQLQTDLIIVKNLIKSFVPSLLKKAGLDTDSINTIMTSIEEKTSK